MVCCWWRRKNVQSANGYSHGTGPRALWVNEFQWWSHSGCAGRSPQESQPAQPRVHLASGATALGWPRLKDGKHTHAQSSLLQRSSKKESVIVALQESVTKTSRRDSLHKRESAISHGSRKPRTETVGAHQWEKPVVNSRQRGMKPQWKDAGGRKSVQHPNPPQPKLSPVQGAVGSAHQESDSTVTNKHSRTDHQPSKNPRLRGIGRNIYM